MLGSLAIIALSLINPQTPSGQALPSDGIKFETRVTKSVQLNYLVYTPDSYSLKSGQRYPLMVFLHGSGERGSDLNVVRVHGPFKELSKGRKFPFIIVAPQAAERTSWDPDALHNMLKDITKRYRVDKDRIYLTGLSMGGYGTWAWACAEPKTFAAIAPVCGGGNPSEAIKLKNIPTWVRHGDADKSVPLQQSIDMVTALKNAGGDVRFDIIPGGPHDVWSDFYANQEVYDWFLTKKRSR